MVKYSEAALDATFGALADPTRRAILARLARGESSVGELARPFRVSLPAVSKHLRVLEHAGLLRQEKDGRVRRCRLRVRPLRDAAEWVKFYQSFWEDQFDALEDFLKQTQEEEKQWPPPGQAPKQPSKSNGHSLRRGKKSSKRGSSRA